MDSIVLYNRDVEAVFKWKDNHADLVRRCQTPRAAIQIVLPDVHIIVKGIRKDDNVKLHLNRDGKSLGSYVVEIRRDGGCLIPELKNHMKVDQEGKQSVLAVYFAVMALMAFGDQTIQKEPVEHRQHVNSGSHHAKTGGGLTYILHRSEKGIQIAPRGSHASPSGQFSVRGHFRHYKSGKVVWIEEYQKGTGKKRKKEYRLGDVSE